MHVGWLWAMLRGSRWPRPLQLIRDAGQGSKVEEITSEVLRFGTKLLKLKRLWPYDINHRNNTNTSNNSHIRTEHAFCMKKTHWNMCFIPWAESQNCGHLRAITRCIKMSWNVAHKAIPTENIFQTEIQTEATNCVPNQEHYNCFLWVDPLTQKLQTTNTFG